MGTNYYLHKSSTDDEPLHIGKSSGGWHFALRVYPEYGINTLKDWKIYLCSGIIIDEYGQLISYSNLIDIITDRKRENPVIWLDRKLLDNYAEPGLNNLVRSKINGYHCIGHGEGTWDYIVSDFS